MTPAETFAHVVRNNVNAIADPPIVDTEAMLKDLAKHGLEIVEMRFVCEECGDTGRVIEPYPGGDREVDCWCQVEVGNERSQV